MEWLENIGAFADGLSMIQKTTYVIAALGATVGLFYALLVGSIKLYSSIIEIRTTIRVKRIQDRNIKSGNAPDFTKDDIKKSLRDYVIPDCAQTDPSNSADLRRVAAVRQSVFEAVDNFIANSENKHLLLLADTGMGKTTFCLNFLDRLHRSSDGNDGCPCVVIPLGRPAAIDKIRAVTAKNDTVLILDAFDEDVEAISDSAARLGAIMNEAASFRSVIVTCRSQFFRDDQSIPHRTGVRVVRPRRGGAVGEYVFETLYLLPFSPKQINTYVRGQFPILKLGSSVNRAKAYRIIKDIPELSVRPMLLSLLPELVKENREVNHLYDLYDFMTSTWSKRESLWIEPIYLYSVSKALAVYIYTSRSNRSSERVSIDELHMIAKQVGAPEDVWGHLSARSLLNRDSEGAIKFSHRSIMEFFFVQAAIDGDETCFVDVYWTDFMRDLFVSWGNTKTGHENIARAKEILSMDLEAIGLSPLSQPLAVPANYNGRSYTQKVTRTTRRVANSWRSYSTKLLETSGRRVLQDHEYGLVWIVPPEGDYGDPGVRGMTHLQVMKGTVADGLASRDQFLSLLEAESHTNTDLISRDTHLWLGDKINGQPVVVSISHQPLVKPGLRSLGSFAVKDRSGTNVWAYTVATRPTSFGEKVPMFKAIPTMVSEIDWETGKRLHMMSEEEMMDYINATFNELAIIKSLADRQPTVGQIG